MSPKKCTPFKKMLFAIILIVLVEQGFSLKCYVCKSNKDGDCGKDLKDELKQECEKSQPATTTTEPSTTSTTTEPSSTASSITEPSSTASSITEPSSTASSITEPSSTASSITEPSSTASSTASSTTSSTTVASTSKSPEDSKKPETVNRVRRQSALKTRADTEYVCYKYEQLESSETQISRGCVKKADFTCEGKSECQTCSEDGCNSASLANLGILSIILPIVFTVSTFLNR